MKMTIELFSDKYREFVFRFGKKPDHVAMTKSQVGQLQDEMFAGIPQEECNDIFGLPIWYCANPVEDSMFMFGNWVRNDCE